MTGYRVGSRATSIASESAGPQRPIRILGGPLVAIIAIAAALRRGASCRLRGKKSKMTFTQEAIFGGRFVGRFELGRVEPFSHQQQRNQVGVGCGVVSFNSRSLPVGSCVSHGMIATRETAFCTRSMCGRSSVARATSSGSVGDAATNDELITQAQGSMPALRRSA